MDGTIRDGEGGEGISNHNFQWVHSLQKKEKPPKLLDMELRTHK